MTGNPGVGLLSSNVTKISISACPLLEPGQGARVACSEGLVGPCNYRPVCCCSVCHHRVTYTCEPGAGGSFLSARLTGACEEQCPTIRTTEMTLIWISLATIAGLCLLVIACRAFTSKSKGEKEPPWGFRRDESVVVLENIPRGSKAGPAGGYKPGDSPVSSRNEVIVLRNSSNMRWLPPVQLSPERPPGSTAPMSTFSGDASTTTIGASTESTEIQEHPVRIGSTIGAVVLGHNFVARLSPSPAARSSSPPSTTSSGTGVELLVEAVTGRGARQSFPANPERREYQSVKKRKRPNFKPYHHRVLSNPAKSQRTPVSRTKKLWRANSAVLLTNLRGPRLTPRNSYPRRRERHSLPTTASVLLSPPRLETRLSSRAGSSSRLPLNSIGETIPATLTTTAETTVSHGESITDALQYLDDEEETLPPVPRGYDTEKSLNMTLDPHGAESSIILAAVKKSLPPTPVRPPGPQRRRGVPVSPISALRSLTSHLDLPLPTVPSRRQSLSQENSRASSQPSGSPSLESSEKESRLIVLIGAPSPSSATAREPPSTTPRPRTASTPPAQGTQPTTDGLSPPTNPSSCPTHRTQHRHPKHGPHKSRGSQDSALKSALLASLSQASPDELRRRGTGLPEKTKPNTPKPARPPKPQLDNLAYLDE